MSLSSEVKLVQVGKPRYGRYTVTLMVGDDVIIAGKFDPADEKSVTEFIQKAIEKFDGLKGQEDDLRQKLLNFAKPPAQRGVDRTEDAHPYIEKNGRIMVRRVVREGEVLEALTNFTAHIVADVIRDDGVEKSTAVELEAKLNGQTSCFTVTSSEFTAMTWPIPHLGGGAIVGAGAGTKDHARVAIQQLSPQPIPKKTVYTHIGWRQIQNANGGNGWCYVHGGGAVNNISSVLVDLPQSMAAYKLPEVSASDNVAKYVQSSLRMLSLAKDEVIFPLYLAIWRAVLGKSDFGIHLSGPSGVFKSEVAALAQQHWGPEMDARHLPGNWMSTDNALEGQLSAAADAITVVDDFAPNGSQHDRAKWNIRADRIMRSQGNSSGRGRMRADGTLRNPRPPRGTTVSTGEEIPQGQSIRARMHITEISKGDIKAPILTICQQDARNGDYAKAMAAYVGWLAPQYGKIRAGLRAEAEELRAKASTATNHCRTPAIVAELATGYRHFLKFARECGAVTESEATALWERAWAALLGGAEDQQSHQSANEPATRFLELLGSAITSGHAHLADIGGDRPADASKWGWRCEKLGGGTLERWTAMGDRVGWVNKNEGQIWLEPTASYRAAQAMALQGADGLMITAQTLRKRLDEKGLVVRPGGRRELLTRKVAEGSQRSVLVMSDDDDVLFKSTITTIHASDTASGSAEPNDSAMADSENGDADGGEKSPSKQVNGHSEGNLHPDAVRVDIFAPLYEADERAAIMEEARV